MGFIDRSNNIYVIDTNMHDFDHYCAAYIVEGKEIALIDTGLPCKLEMVRAGIKAHGFSVSDISHIFVTHTEHADHSGNVGPFLRESPNARVYIHPAGSQILTDPSGIASATSKSESAAKIAEKFKGMEAVPVSRIQYLNDGDVFDLGNGEKLKIIFAPGHQPGNIAILEEKNKGLFVGDLVGNCFPDANAHYPLNPPGSDSIATISSLRKLMDIGAEYIYMGHYGISKDAKTILSKAINIFQSQLEIGRKCLDKGRPEDISGEVYKMILPELEKLRSARGEAIYQYATRDHVGKQVSNFADYCQARLKS